MQLSAQNGTDFTALSARAATAREANDIKLAISLYQDALRVNDKWEEGWWLLGSLQYDSDQYAAGANSFRHLLDLRPGIGPAVGLLGLCEFEIGQYDVSLGHIRQALNLGIGDQAQMAGVLRFHEALLLTRDGRFEAALVKYAGLASSKVTDPQVITGMGLTALRRAELPANVSAQDRDLAMTAGKALAAMLGGDTDSARQEFEALVQRFPKAQGVHYAYGYFIYGSDPDRALNEWQRELEINPRNVGAQGMLAWGNYFRGDKDVAFQEAKAALALNKDLTVAQIVYGRSLVQSGQLRAGVTMLEAATRQEPENLETHLALASAYSEAGEKSAAQEERQRCLQLRAGAGQVASH